MSRVLALFLALLVGAASAEHYQAWKTDTEYRYLVRGRTLAALQDVSDRYIGMMTKAILIVRPKSPESLEAKIIEARYARIHTRLPQGWSSKISEKTLDMKQFPLSDKVFEIRMKHGVIRELIVEKDLPTWQVNVLKSIVGQLQVDTQGENLIPSRHNQAPEVPENKRQGGVNAMYKTMEDSVSGKCEVLYDINPLPETVAETRPELLPMPELRGTGGQNSGEAPVIDIVKTRNYDNCQQRVGYHFGITGSVAWEPGSNDNGQFMSRSSVSRVIVTGNLETFTIQSSVTTNKVLISPNWHDSQKGMVGSRVGLTLLKMGPIDGSAGLWSAPANPESTGNLVYSYSNPFAGPGEYPARPGASAHASSSSEARDSREERQSRFSKGEDDDDESPDSGSVDSLERNEGRSYWQPRPALDQPAPSPLLPFFVGNAGKSIHGSSEVDPIASAKSLAAQIGSDVQNPNAMVEEQSLEKFTILARLIRTMSTAQIAEVQSELYRTPNQIHPGDEGRQNVERSTWNAFRDAVAQAGTGPALRTIKSWIKEKKIRGMEAASVVGSLSKVARTPTPEYIEEFFEMATMPETMEEEYLNTSAIINFAELLRYSRINGRSAHNRYPVHAYGPFSSKHDHTVFQKYIPYMAKELTKSMERKELAKSHVFIRALGNVAHPAILGVFEPYLEGKKSATNFQRFVMMISIEKLSTLKPRLGRAIFWRIYRNTAEAHPLRCAAVFLFMLTDPPASMLQRMAEFTNYDSNKHVNSAVKSAIESASQLTTPELRGLASKARAARPLLSNEIYDLEYTRNYFFDGSMEEMNLAYRKGMTYIGSDDTIIPQDFYTTLEMMYGSFQMPRMEFGVAMSRAKDFTAWLKEMWKMSPWKSQESPDAMAIDDDKQKPSEFSPENIAKMLKIEAENGENLEAILVIRSMYNNKLMTLDKNSLSRMPQMMRRAAEALKRGHNFDMEKTQSYDVTLSFPTESGLPFVYTSKVPALMKFSGRVEGRDEPGAAKASAEMRMLFSMQMQSRFGFLAPFERQHYLAGVDKNLQLYIPMRASMNYNKKDKRAMLEIEPIDRNDKYKIFHRSTVPFTSRRNALSMIPVAKDRETHVLTSDNQLPKKSSVVLGGPNPEGMYFTVEDVRSHRLSRNYREDENIGSSWWSSLFFPLAEKTIDYSMIDMYFVPDPSNKQSIVLHGSFMSSDEAYDDSANPQRESASYNQERSRQLKPRAPRVANNLKSEDPKRVKQLLMEAGKDIAAAEGYAMNFGVELTGREPMRWFATMAYADSKIDEKSRVLSYSRLTDARSTTDFESCAAFESTSSLAPAATSHFQDYLEKKNYEDASSPGESRRPVTREFDMDVRFGENCEKSESIRIRGKQAQTESYQSWIKTMPMFAECLKEMKKSDGSGGGSWMPACQKLRVKANTMNEMNITMEFDPQMRSIAHSINRLIKDVGATFHNRGLSSRPNYMAAAAAAEKKAHDDDSMMEKETLEFSLELMENEESVNFAVKTPETVVMGDKMNIGQLVLLGMNADPDLSMDDLLMHASLKDDGSPHHHCTLDSEWATSFDGSTYPMDLGKCWYVAMTTFPRNSKDDDEKSGDKIDSDMRVSILVGDNESGKKKNVRIMLGNQKVEMKSSGDAEVDVNVDGKRIDFGQTPTSYRYKKGQETVFEVMKRSDNSVRLFSPKYDVDVIYDGRVRIKASDKYRNDVRGLCGNYDGESSNDLASPQGCIASNPAQFVASYALPNSGDCQGPPMDEGAGVCRRDKIRPRNVMTDREIGRQEKNSDWGYHGKKQHRDSDSDNDGDNGKNDAGKNKRCTAMRTYVKEDDEVTCFSVRPIPNCASGCKPKNTKWKEVQLYCMKTGEASKRMAERINRGANPDLSQKETSKTMSIKVPMGCRSSGASDG